MGIRLKQIGIWGIVLLCIAGTATASSDASSRPSSHNDTNHSPDDHGGHGSGVKLVSWRWDEYRTIIIFLLMIITVGILKITFHHIPVLSHHLPESCVLIAIGVVVGSVIYFSLESHAHHFPKFTSQLFFNVLLPPIILDSAYTLYDREFLSNFLSVVSYAVFGTLFNVFAIGYLLYLVYYLGWMGSFEIPLDAIKCLVFSSLISAVDPVAVLAIFEEVGVNMGLYFLVFGESLLNDGVTVVLYNTMISLGAQETIDSMQYVLAFLSFFTVVFGGLAVGCVVGAFSAFLLKFTKHTRVLEPLIIFSTAYLAFIFCENLHWSGIIGLIGCGVVQKRYAFPNISRKSYTTVKYSIKTLAAFSDCIIFLFLGIVTVSNDLQWHTGFVLWTVLFCLVVRFVGVFGLTWIINKRRVKQITLKEQFVIAYGGLRGAVGFSLALILPEDPFKPIFLTATLTMIYFTVFIQGTTIKFLCKKLNIARKTTGTKMIGTDVNEKTIDHVMAGVESVIGKYSRRRMLQHVRDFDNNYTKKLLIRKDAEDIMALRFERISLDEHYARLYGPAVMVHEQFSDRKHEGKGDLNDEEIKKMKTILSKTPFDKFVGAAREDSPDVIAKLKNESENKFKMLTSTLMDNRRLQVRQEETIPEEEDQFDDAMRTRGGSEAAEEKNRLLHPRSRSGMDAKSIKMRYRDAKLSFKQGSKSDISSIRRESSIDGSKKNLEGLNPDSET